MASAKFQLSANGGISWLAPDVPLSSGLGLAQVGGNASVYARLASTAGVDTVAWSIVSASENAAELTLVQYPDKSVHILVPLDSAASWLLRAVVNGGIDPLAKRATPDLVSALAIKVLTTGGLELLAPGEGTEGDRAFGWTTSFNALASAGIGAGTATRVRADASAYLSGDVTFAQGTNVTLAQVGSTITINASGGGGGALPSPYTATLVTYESIANSLLITGPSGSYPDTKPPTVIVRARDNTDAATDSSGGDAMLVGGDIPAGSVSANGGGNAFVRGGNGPAAGQGWVSGGLTLVESGTGGAATIFGRDGNDHTTLTNVTGGAVGICGGGSKGTGGGGIVYINGGSTNGGAPGAVLVTAGQSQTAVGAEVDIAGGYSTSNTGGQARVRGGQGTTGGLCTIEGGSGATPGNARLLGGAQSGANGNGGNVLMSGATGAGTGTGGTCSVGGGDGGATGNGGALNLAGGASTGGTSKVGGAASLTGGVASGTTGTGGHATVTGGVGTATCGDARLQGGHAGASGVVPGNVTAYGGNANAGNVAGGGVYLQGGGATGTGQGGSCNVTGGSAASGGVSGWASVLGGTGGLTGGRAQVIAGAGVVNTAGGTCIIAGGSASGTGDGGNITATGGAATNTGAGGAVAIAGGAAGATATSKAGGAVSLTGGGSAGTTGIGGSATLAGGTGTTTGGEVLLTPGTGASSLSAKTRVTRGAFQVEESTAVVKQLSETCAPVTTTSTTPTLVWSYALGTSEILAVTVEAVADPGTAATAGLVAYKAVFRRTTGDNSGAAQQVGTTQDMSPSGNVPKSSFALTIALNGNAVEVKAVAPNATSTLWAAAVGGLARTGPV